MWTRRELLRAVGAGATLSALTPLGCGVAGRARVGSESLDRDSLRAALRDAVAVAGETLGAPFAYATVRRRVRAVVDLDRRTLDVEERMVAIIGGRDGDEPEREHATGDLSPAGIAAAAAAVAAGGSSGAAAGSAVRPVIDHDLVTDDPRAIDRRRWLAEADALAARLAEHGSSRVVYRAAWVVCDDEETWIVDDEGDHRQRLVRGRAGASLVAWHGREPVAGEASTAARGVPGAAQLADGELARAADDALTLYTPGGAPAGETAIVLAPALVGAILERVLAMPAVAARARPAAIVRLADDPTSPAAFAGFAIDDRGAPARATALIEGGAFASGGASAIGAMRRHGPRWGRWRGPTHLDLAAGEEPAAALEAAIALGVVLDGVRELRLDADGSLVLRAARARELSRGRRTGRVWGDLELRADVGQLLAAAVAVSQERQAIAFADDGAPARGALVPWMVTRGELASGSIGALPRGGG